MSVHCRVPTVHRHSKRANPSTADDMYEMNRAGHRFATQHRGRQQKSGPGGCCFPLRPVMKPDERR